MCAACGSPPASPPPPVPSAGRFASLQHGHFRVYVLATLLAMMGDNIEHVISYWVLWEKFRSPALAGFAVVSHWVPHLVLSVYIGRLSDRHDCRRLIQVGMGLFGAVSLAWGGLFLTDTVEIWHSVVLLIVHGVASAIWGPAGQLLIHDMVGSSALASAVRLQSTARNLGILLAPAVGAGLMLWLGPAWGILANVLVYLPMAAFLQLTPYTGHGEHVPAAGRAGVGLFDSVRVLRQVWWNKTIVSMVALAGVSALFVGNAFQAQMPAFAEAFGTGRSGTAYGALLAANAAGAVVGGFALEAAGYSRVRPGAAIVAGSAWSLAMLGFAATNSYPLALLLLFVAGVFNIASVSIAQTLVQVEAPPRQRGEVIGLFNVAAFGLRVGSGVLVGGLGVMVGVHWSLGVNALAQALAIGALLLVVRRASAART